MPNRALIIADFGNVKELDLVGEFTRNPHLNTGLISKILGILVVKVRKFRIFNNQKAKRTRTHGIGK